MRVRTFVGIVISSVILLVGFAAAWIALPRLPESCQDGDNTCLYHKMAEIDRERMENVRSDQQALPQMLDLCSRMFDSHKKDECLFVVVGASGREVALEACSRFYDITYQSYYVSTCELREIQIALRTASLDLLNDMFFDRMFSRCAPLTNEYSSKDMCFFELSLHFVGELARRACAALRPASENYRGYPYSREVCLKQIDALEN